MNIQQNLLPLEFQKRLLIAVRLRQWCRIWGVLVLVLLVSGVKKHVEHRQLQERWSKLDRQSAPIVQTKLDNVKLAKQLKDLDEKIALIDSVNDAGHHLALIGVISHSVLNTGEAIQVQSCTFLELTPVATNKTNAVPSPPPSAKTTVPDDTRTMKIELRGLSVDEHSIARFVKILKNIDAFAQVELKTVRGTEVSNQPLRTYQIECAL